MELHLAVCEKVIKLMIARPFGTIGTLNIPTQVTYKELLSEKDPWAAQLS